MVSNVHGRAPMVMANNDVFTMGPYRARKDSMRVSVLDKYEIIGYIASGTYGKVYKARTQSNAASTTTNATNSIKNGTQDSQQAAQQVAGNGLPSIDSSSTANDNNSDKKKSVSYYAIKKFKTDKEGVEQLHYIGISQSACREMSLCRELDNKHLTKLVEIFLERKNIYMVYEYAEYDLLQIIHYHSHPKKKLIPHRMIKSIMWQIIDGVSFLHQNWILHRDLKPANIMVTANGIVKIGDLGLARKFSNLLQTLYTGDKVVVTIWYRAPELLLGARHYTPAIDVWAIGCIFAELIGLQPIFKGEEAKMDSKKGVPFQANQMQRILEVLGTPTYKNWSNLHKYPEYDSLNKFPKYRDNLANWYHSTGGRDKITLDLLCKLLIYDPVRRIDALDALDHPYFTDNDFTINDNVFESLNYKYPARRIHTDDNDIMNLGNTYKNKINNNNNNNNNNNINSQQQNNSNNNSTATLGGLGVNRRILAAAAAAAAAVSGNEPSRKKRR